ncbi:MAG TPA: hypothetical protein ENH82_19105 [bacterium]|nr:hypothetical protein [bacterium]
MKSKGKGQGKKMLSLKIGKSKEGTRTSIRIISHTHRLAVMDFVFKKPGKDFDWTPEERQLINYMEDKTESAVEVLNELCRGIERITGKTIFDVAITVTIKEFLDK